MAIDWLAASVEQRKALYRAVRRLMAEEAIGWNGIYESLGRSVPTGSGYEDNFRAGRLARQTANQIYRWMVREYPDHAARLDRDLSANEAEGRRWRSFLQEHGRFERIAAVLLPEPSIGVVAFAKPEPLARPVIPLGAPFCFEIDSDRDGVAIAFQNVGESWHALPLRQGALSEAVIWGCQYLPRQMNSEPLALSEEAHSGRHGFLFLIGNAALIEAITPLVPDGAIPPSTLDRIAAALEPHQAECAALRINLLFVK